MLPSKQAVYEFWNQASCGENLYLDGISAEHYLQHSKIRYELEPFISAFAEFNQWRDCKVLEIGVGLGADHQSFAEAGAHLTGIDITERGIAHTRQRFKALNFASELQCADAEALPFENMRFDLVYSWGVLHHTPDTVKAVDEVWRVLKPGGKAKIMIYHKHSLIGWMLWIRYALLKFRPQLTLAHIYDRYLESPGTKAYTIEEAKLLFAKFSAVEIKTVLTHGDLLTSAAGQKHQGLLLTVARRLWPRWFIQRWLARHGLFMLIHAKK